jgi:hypothetical protein
VPVQVTIEAHGSDETWTRDFAGRRFESRLSEAPEGSGRLIERFGPLSVTLAVPAGRRGLRMRVVDARLGPVRLPAALRPRARAREWVEGAQRFRFDVSLSVPLFGFLVRYQGWLTPVAKPEAVL